MRLHRCLAGIIPMNEYKLTLVVTSFSFAMISHIFIGSGLIIISIICYSGSDQARDAWYRMYRVEDVWTSSESKGSLVPSH